MGGELFKRGIMKMRIGKRGFDSGYEGMCDTIITFVEQINNYKYVCLLLKSIW